MLVALYVGNHAADSFTTRLGWAATRAVQRGEFKQVTHCEAILDVCGDQMTIASASLRDGACVRTKHGVRLTRGNWRVVNVSAWDVKLARQWFAQHGGEPYDWRGAMATVLPGHHRDGAWFCNEAVGAPFIRSPQSYGPAQFAAICFTLGHEQTDLYVS